MDFGVTFQTDPPAWRVIKLTQRAEALGFTHAWTFDSHILWQEPYVIYAQMLAATERILVPGGRLVVITFHSGEDRIVKRFISEREGRCSCPPDLPVCVCGAKPVFRRSVVRRPSEAEVEENPRSTSARLRVAIRTAEPPEVGEDAS
jgi:hypothetical protein